MCGFKRFSDVCLCSVLDCFAFLRGTKTNEEAGGQVLGRQWQLEGGFRPVGPLAARLPVCAALLSLSDRKFMRQWSLATSIPCLHTQISRDRIS